MLTANEVERFLRQFEPLMAVSVQSVSEVISPWVVRVHGLVPIHGEIHAFETEVDLSEFGSAQDLVKLAEQLLRSFEAAAVGRARS